MLAVTSRRGRGFTLIELLVVVGIIAILIAILAAALSRARATAQRTVCGTRLKAMLQATNMYLSEYNNCFPVNGLLFPKSGVPKMYQTDQMMTQAADATIQDWQPGEDANLQHHVPGTTWWMGGALWTYMGQKAAAYMCPADDGMRTSTNTSAGNQPLTLDSQGNVRQGPNSGGYWSYSVNTMCNSLGRFRDNFTNGLPWTDPLRVSEVRSSAGFIVFLEEDAASYFNDEVLEPPAITSGNMLSNRHSGYGNVGFLDSHVEPIKASDFNKSTGTTLSDMLKNPYSWEFFPQGTEGIQ